MIHYEWNGSGGDPARPRVTYGVQTYGQEAFVAEALTAALAQSYPTLDVLVTDDASLDRTFDVALEVARAYRGPHRLTLHQSERNLGIAAHFNAASPLVGGEFLHWTSGDDVAEPTQIDELLTVLAEPGVIGAWSSFRLIDQHGADLGVRHDDIPTFALDLADYANGAFLDFPYGGTCCYSRAMLDRFGPLRNGIAPRGLEHHLGFRAALLGEKRYVRGHLIRKRQHLGRRTFGESAQDRQTDPMTVHQQRVRTRVDILNAFRAELLDQPQVTATRETLAGVMAQIAIETERLRALDEFRLRLEAAGPGGLDCPHSGWQFPPNGLRFVEALPEFEHNLVASECQYHAVPWRLGPVFPYQLRNRLHADVISAWAKQDVLALLASGRRRAERNLDPP